MVVRPFWAGDYLPASAANKHFCAVGTTGSGKTITLLLLMQSVLPAIATKPDQRALIYDAKGDVLSYLYPMVGTVPIHILHPFDRRSSRWDMARDITTPLAAQQTAMLFVPPERNSTNPFFADAARLLLQGIFLALAHRLQTRGESWTLRDVLLIARSRDKLSRLLAQCPYTKEIAFYVAPETKEATSILATLGTKLLPFEPVAAVWDHATRSFSLDEWIHGNSVLVLGNDESARTALDVINQAIFKRATELVLAQGESEQRRTWFFLDEVREAGGPDGLSRLMTKGRTKGACVALGFQDIEGMHDAFGDKIANEILGQCNSKAILRLMSPETAQWASELRGKYLRWEEQSSRSHSESHDKEGTSSTSEESASYSLQERSAVYSSQFFDLPFPDPINGLTAYYITAEGGYLKTFNPFPLLPRRDVLIRDFWPRPDSEQYLLPWSEAEEKSFLDTVPIPVMPISEVEQTEEEATEPIVANEGEEPLEVAIPAEAIVEASPLEEPAVVLTDPLVPCVPAPPDPAKSIEETSEETSYEVYEIEETPVDTSVPREPVLAPPFESKTERQIDPPLADDFNPFWTISDNDEKVASSDPEPKKDRGSNRPKTPPRKTKKQSAPGLVPPPADSTRSAQGNSKSADTEKVIETTSTSPTPEAPPTRDPNALFDRIRRRTRDEESGAPE